MRKGRENFRVGRNRTQGMHTVGWRRVKHVRGRVMMNNDTRAHVKRLRIIRAHARMKKRTHDIPSNVILASHTESNARTIRLSHTHKPTRAHNPTHTERNSHDIIARRDQPHNARMVCVTTPWGYFCNITCFSVAHDEYKFISSSRAHGTYYYIIALCLAHNLFRLNRTNRLAKAHGTYGGGVCPGGGRARHRHPLPFSLPFWLYQQFDILI